MNKYFIIGLAMIALLAAYFLEKQSWETKDVCIKNGYLDGTYDKGFKQYVCIDHVCPEFSTHGQGCENKPIYFNNLSEIKPEGAFIRIGPDKTFSNDDNDFTGYWSRILP